MSIPSWAKAVKIVHKNKSKYPQDWKNKSKEFRAKNQGNICAVCGCSGTKDNPIHAHHVIPVAKNGRSAEIFLKKLCLKCHGIRHGRKLL